MKAGVVVENLNEAISVKTFLIALACLFALMLGTVISTSILGHTPVTPIETIVSITAEKTVAVQSGDLNQMDLKPQPKQIEDAIAGLHEQTVSGLVPIIRASDQMTVFKAYAADFKLLPETQGIIALVMVDFGLSAKAARTAIDDLPAGVSLALSPYARDAQKLTSDARRKNHEVWLELPLQTKSYPGVDTGPNTLLTQLNADGNNQRMLQSLGTATGYAGVVVNNGDAFENAASVLQKIMADITARGLGLVESDPDGKFITALAVESKIPFTRNEILLDQVTSPKDLEAQLNDLQGVAVKNKKLVVFFKPYPVTIKAIQDWSKTLSNQGIQLAPVSAVINAAP